MAFVVVLKHALSLPFETNQPRQCEVVADEPSDGINERTLPAVGHAAFAHLARAHPPPVVPLFRRRQRRQFQLPNALFNDLRVDYASMRHSFTAFRGEAASPASSGATCGSRSTPCAREC